MTDRISPAQGADGGRTILVVDDEPIILLGTCALLTSLGHVVFSAKSGPAALAKLEEHRDISLLVTDLQMAGMSGVELGRAAVASRPELAVIIATGRIDLSAEERHGFGMIAKPFTREELAQAIDAILQPVTSKN